MKLFNDFFPDNVVTFISGSDVDFTLPADGFSLTEKQQDFLKQHCDDNIDIVLAPRQVHGRQVVVVDEGFRHNPKLLMADAIITDLTDVAIGVRTADCLPVFFYDPKHHAVAIAHAGWRGTQEHIVVHVLELMKQQYNTNPGDVLVGFGPCISADVYEVGKEFSDYFPKHVEERSGHFFMDLKGENASQLKAVGVREHHIVDANVCSFNNRECHSYRRDKEQSGRMLSLILLKEMS